jgi:predicted AlkP superfamily phosphohydrolase/phosphomutase
LEGLQSPVSVVPLEVVSLPVSVPVLPPVKTGYESRGTGFYGSIDLRGMDVVQLAGYSQWVLEGELDRRGIQRY